MSFFDATAKTLIYSDEEIFYYTLGEKNKDAIIFLHPAFCDHEIYEAQTEYFSKDYFTIYIDMVGHGKSQMKKPVVNMSDMPDIIADILKKEGIASAHLVGTSMGSLVAQGFAHQYPEMTKSVTVVGGYSIHRNNDEILQAQAKEMAKWMGKMLFNMKGFRRYVTDTSVYTERGKEVFLRGSQNFRRKSFLAMNGMDAVFDKLEQGVKYPLFIVCGEHDLELIRNSSAKWAQAEDNAKFIEIEDAGHCVSIDNPQKFNKIVREFIFSCEV